MLHLDEDSSSLQRELQEKELDIIHLNKEIQELQLENKLLKAKVPMIYQNGHTSVRFYIYTNNKISTSNFCYVIE